MFEWKKYNGALVSAAPPHVEPTAEDVAQAKKLGGYRFITYVTDFDCQEETPWWYVIKDTPLIIEEMPSAKKRYRINKGLKHVTVSKIDCKKYGKELYNCFLKAQERYTAHENTVTEEAFLRGIQSDKADYYGVFFKETGELVAYGKNDLYQDCVGMSVMKFHPDYMKYEISAALTYQIIHDYLNEGRCKYIMDGQRSIRHKTNIQDYLEHNFGFRKAYCRLHMVYSTKMGLVVKLLYPFRKIVEKIAGENVLLNNVASVLKMEEISRACRKKPE